MMISFISNMQGPWVQTGSWIELHVSFKDWHMDKKELNSDLIQSESMNLWFVGNDAHPHPPPRTHSDPDSVLLSGCNISFLKADLQPLRRFCSFKAVLTKTTSRCSVSDWNENNNVT